MKAFFTELLGWYGIVAVFGAYILASFGTLGPTDFTFQFLNATGATGIITVSLARKNYQLVILNVAWLLVALIAIVRMF